MKRLHALKTAFLLLLLASGPVLADMHAATEQVEAPVKQLSMSDTRDVADKFMDTMMTSSLTEALDTIKPHWPLSDDEMQNFYHQFASQEQMIANRYGKPLDYALHTTQKVGDVFVKHIFIVRYSRHAIMWSFVFYQGENGWMLNSFHFRDKFDNLFE